MKIDKLRLILVVLLVAYLIMQDVGVGIASPEDTVVSVDPLISTGNIGETFDVNVTVANVTDLMGWSFNMTFNSNVLNVTAVQQGSFLGTAGPTLFTLNKNNTAGWVMPGELKFPATLPGASGSGVLATITFEVMDVGATLLDFVDELTKLNTVVGGNPVPIPRVAVDGVFDNRAIDNDPPVALFNTDPLAAEIDDTIAFNASASYDPDDWLLSYYWDFGDGTNVTGIVKHVKGNTDLVKNHDYKQSGIFTVTLTVTDYYGVTDTTTADVAVGHDVAVVNVETPFTAVIPGVPVPINVTVTNERGFNETFNVTAYYDNTTIGIKTVNLGSLAETSVLFTWNTTSLPEDDYTIIVEASNVTNEINIANNVKNLTITLASFNRILHSVEVGGLTFHVVTESNSTVSSFTFVQTDKKIYFNATGGDGTGGSCNVTIPKKLLDASPDQWDVSINDIPVIPPQLIITGNSTHTFIHLTYTHSTQKIQIIGQTVATPPVAIFTYSPGTLIVGNTIAFNASASYDLDGNITSYEWNFGDGTPIVTVADPTTTHVYSTADIYTVTVTVKDDDGLSSETAQKLITILQPPTASFTYSPESSKVDEVVTFNASSSYDSDGEIVKFEWNFDDGNVTAVNNATTVITHTFAAAGTYMVTLNVTDNDGLTNTNTQSAIIGKVDSTISITLSTTSITVGENTTLSGLIDPVRSGATVTIWYRLSGEVTWNTATTSTTDQNSQYSYVWTPGSAGTYELKASWEGDENTFADETEVQELTVQESTQPSGLTVLLPIIALAATIVIAIVAIVGYFVKTRKST